MQNKNHITVARILEKSLFRKGLINSNDTAIVFQDLDQLREKLDLLFRLFPDNSLHAIAIKAMPLPAILRKMGLSGAGLEAASLPELVLALKSGIAPEKIVFDSPVKTRDEIAFALKNHVHLNADNLDEAGRIASILPALDTRSTIGLRINPQVGTGRIQITSVAGDYSKFGTPIKSQRQQIVDAFLKYEWLTGIHVHVGSQGCELPLLVDGVKTVVRLAEEINQELKLNNRPNRIANFDMGGGLPVAYLPDDHPPTMEEYVHLLQKEVPELFDGTYRLITEFGRWIHVNTGFTASRVEYVKNPMHPGSPETAMTHLGADMFIRECYLPEQWSHVISVADGEGKIKAGESLSQYMIAGPLCFQGDIIARNILLPEINPGDWLIIHDTGGYTLSMWSRYNSREMPKVIGYRQAGAHFEILKDREKPEDLFDFWS